MTDKLVGTASAVVGALATADSLNNALIGAGIALAPAVFDFVRSMGATDRLLAAHARNREDYLLGMRSELARDLQEQAARAADFQERLQRLEQRLQDQEFEGLQANFCLEGTREATRERRRMIAIASATSFNVDLSIADASNAERVIRELNPEDVIYLRAVSTWHTAGQDGQTANKVAALVGSGCVRGVAGAGGFVTYQVTPRGFLVERLLRSYEPKT